MMPVQNDFEGKEAKHILNSRTKISSSISKKYKESWHTHQPIMQEKREHNNHHLCDSMRIQRIRLCCSILDMCHRVVHHFSFFFRWQALPSAFSFLFLATDLIKRDIGFDLCWILKCFIQLVEVNMSFFWFSRIKLFNHFTDCFLWEHCFLRPHFKRFLQELSICTEPIAREYVFCLLLDTCLN